MNLLANIPGKRLAQRRPHPASTGQRWLAIAAWLAALGVGLALNWRLGWPEREATLFFGVIYVLASAFSVRLPGGAYVGLENTAIAAAVLVVGHQRAMLIAPAIGGPLALVLLGLTYLFRQTGRYRSTLIVERLWDSASLALCALATGWLYEQAGGHVFPQALEPMAFLLVIGLVLGFFLLRLTTLAVWLAFSRLNARPYYRDHGWTLVTSGLIATLIFAPMLAAQGSVGEGAPWLLLIPYGAGVLLLYNINATQMNHLDRIDDLRTLNSVGQVLTATLEFDELLETLRDEIGKLLDVSGFYLAMYDRERAQVEFPMQYENGVPLPPAWRVFSNGMTEYIITHGRSVLLQHHVPDHARAFGIDASGWQSRTFLGVPIFAGQEVIGVIALRHFEQEYAYDENDQRLLETIAAAAGVALQNAQLYTRSRRQGVELTSLNKVSSLVSASLDLNEVVQTICAVAKDVMHADKSAVFLLDHQLNATVLAGWEGLSENYREQSKLIALSSSRALSVRRGEPVILENVNDDIRVDDVRELITSEGFQAAVEVPMRSSDSIIGSLVVYYEKPRRFDTNEIELMGTLAGQVAIAVENARLFDAINTQRGELETLYETGRLVNASLNVANVLKAVARGILNAVEGDLCVALLESDDGSHLRVEQSYRKAGSRLYSQQAPATRYPLADLPELAPSAESPHVLALDGLPDGLLKQSAEELGLKSGLALPLVIHRELVGLLLVGSQNEAPRVAPETQQLAAALADQAAVAVQNARLFERTDVALARRLDQLATLEMLAQQMTRRLDLQAVIDLLVDAAATSTEAEIAALLLLDPNAQVLRQMAAVGSEAVNAPKVWPADKGLTGLAIQTGNVVLASEVSEHAEYVETTAGIRSELAVPVLLDNRRLGVINLESTRPAAFRPEQVDFVSNLAEHAAIAIQNAQLFEAVQRRADEFQTLRAVAIDLLSSSDSKHTLQVIAQQAVDQTGARDIHIYLYDNQTGQLSFGTSLWNTGEVDLEFASPRPDGITMTVARSGEPMVVRTPQTHPIFEKVMDSVRWQEMGGIVSMPLFKRDQVIGVFNIAFDNPTRITDDTLHFLDLLSTQAALAIDNALLLEETLQNRNNLQAILDSINDGILMFDVENRLQMVNPRVEYLLNVRAEEFVGKDFVTIIRQLARLKEEEPAYEWRELIKLARGIQANPYAMTRRSYTIEKPGFRAIEELSIPVAGQDEQLLGRLFVLRDTTREHEIEVYRQEMSHMIVHDLRSPLAGIITGLTMALDEMAYMPEDLHADTLGASLRVALNSGNQLLRLVEEILDVNKLETGEMPLTLEPVNLKDVAERCRELLSGTAIEANIGINIDGPDDLPPVEADADKIERVFVNLMDNALRYTPDGGTISVTIRPAETFQTVIVGDSGEGIREEDRDKIFDRFYQGDVKRRKRGAKGSGLGLTFCRLAVEAHSGSISVGESAEGGAAFTFTLPVRAAVEEQPDQTD